MTHQLAHPAHLATSDLPAGPDFPFVDAVYRTDGLPTAHAGNAFIAALPPIPEDQVLLKALMRFPEFSAAERQLPAAQRIQLTAKLSTLFVPLPRVVELARAMLCMLHEGYLDSQATYDSQSLRARYAQQQAGGLLAAHRPACKRQLSLSLSGSSGAGKSFAIENIANLLPSVIYHPALGKWQIPFLRVEMSYDGESSHALSTQIAEQLDALMPGGNFVELLARRGRSNAEERLFQTLRTARNLGVGMLIVDESQNQRSLGNEDPRQQRKKSQEKGAKSETPLMKLLITASNQAHIPLMFVGTTEFKSAIGTRFTRARRSAGNGSSTWGPLNRAAHGKTGDFEVMLKTLFKYQWTRHVIEYSEQWADLFFEYTQGVTDILVKLWTSCQVRTIAAGGDEVLTEAIVKKAFANEFDAVKFGLTSLKNKDRLGLDVVSDLFAPEQEVGLFSKEEFGAIVPAVPLGVPVPRASAPDAPPPPTTAAAKQGASAARKRPGRKRAEPPSPVARDIHASFVEGADLRGLKPEDIGSDSTARVQVVKFDSRPSA